MHAYSWSYLIYMCTTNIDITQDACLVFLVYSALSKCNAHGAFWQWPKIALGMSYFTQKFTMTHLVVLTVFRYKTFNVFISSQMSTNYLCCTERFPLSWSSLFMFCVLSTSTGSESVYVLTSLFQDWVRHE